MMLEEIKDAKNVGIVLNDYTDPEQFFSALALFLISRNLNKNIYLKLNEKLGLFPILNKKKSQIVLTVDKEISEIYYEKKGKKINLFLKPRDNLYLNDFTCNLMSIKEETCCDLIIAIGFKNFKGLEKEKDFFEHLYKAKIINIDNSSLNKRFGSINLIENGIPIPKIISKNLKEQLSDKNLEALLFENSLNFLEIFNNLSLEENFYISEINDLEIKQIPFMLTILKDYLQMQNFMLLWNKRHAIVYSENDEFIKIINNNFNAQIKNNGALIEKENLAKEDILNLLK